ncbi:MAG TPA: ABC transporter substrate-binding protein [Marmoricola sp.]|nr:ABC transporter substrate-binding protein [Marmoricola sp.]
MRRPKRLATFALPVATALILASCSGGGTEEEGGNGASNESSGQEGGSFSVSTAEPEAFAPTSACYSSGCSQIISMVWTGLLQVDPETTDQQLRMAESIESEDGQNWTIKLKDGFTFHNGEPVNAESFLRGWNYAAYGPNATQVGFFFDKVQGYDDMQGKNPKAKTLAGVKAVDDLTIEVALNEPFSQWPMVMSYTPAFAPMAKECEADIKACNEMPIGNGAYQFAEKWQHNQSITLEKFADYPDEESAGLADEIQFKIYGDLKTAYRDFQAGNLDIVDSVDPSQRLQAEGQYGDQILKAESGSYSYFGFPLYDEAFQDIKMRQALSLAIDRQAIIDRVLNGDYEPATGILPGFVPGAREDVCEFCEYDPERAKQLYDEAGGLPGDRVHIWFNNDGGHEQWVQAMAQGWQQDLGIDFEFESMPFTPYLGALGTRSKVDGPYRLGWLPDYPSPENYLNPIYGAGSSNYGDWGGEGTGTEESHQKFLELVDQGNAAPTVEEGIPAYQAAADIVMDEMVVIPLWFGKTFILYSDNVEGVAYSPLDQILLKQVSVVS